MEYASETTKDEQAGVDWWNRINESLRSKWLLVVQSHGGRVADAWDAYKQSAAPNELVIETQADEARIYRETHNLVGKGGVIVFYNGELQGWVNKLRDPQQWIAGCVAIDQDGKRWQTVAGDDYNGALMWVRIDIEE